MENRFIISRVKSLQRMSVQALAAAGMRMEEITIRLAAVKISEFVGSGDRPELGGFLYPEIK